MKFEDFSFKLDDLLIFNKTNLRLLEKKESNLNLNIKYWKKSGKIISLKKGWYLLAEKYEKESEKDSYLEFIANKLIEPSYLSGEYVLNKYGALTEAVTGITSMTTMSGKEIKNKLATFRYYSVSDKLFRGYKIKKKRGNIVIFEAELAKALFDFFYVRFFRNQAINEKSVENLRINWENISAKDFEKSRAYLKGTRSRKMTALYDIIKNKYYAG
jgi:hypothetical protein